MVQIPYSKPESLFGTTGTSTAQKRSFSKSRHSTLSIAKDDLLNPHGQPDHCWLRKRSPHIRLLRISPWHMASLIIINHPSSRRYIILTSLRGFPKEWVVTYQNAPLPTRTDTRPRSQGSATVSTGGTHCLTKRLPKVRWCRGRARSQACRGRHRVGHQAWCDGRAWHQIGGRRWVGNHVGAGSRWIWHLDSSQKADVSSVPVWVAFNVFNVSTNHGVTTKLQNWTL